MRYSEHPTSLLIWDGLPIWKCILQANIAIDQGSFAPGNFWKVNLENCDPSKSSFCMQPEIQGVEPGSKWQNLRLKEQYDQDNLFIFYSKNTYTKREHIIPPVSSSRI